MKIKVLGSAAGGGFPQWNCACANCSQLRANSTSVRARSQAQVALFPSSGGCFLLNASPDLRTQIISTPELSPVVAPRHSPILGVILTSADVDSVAGLLHLREFQPLRIFATRSVRRIVLEENRIFRVLDRANPPAVWVDVSLDTWFSPEMVNHSDVLAGAQAGAQAGEPAPLQCRMVSLGDAYPDYVSNNLRRVLPAEEAVVGLVVTQAGKQSFYAPTLPGRHTGWKDVAQASDACLVDGTFWDENELIRAGVSSKTAREIGHMSLAGEEGLLRQFGRGLGGRRILIHINNTNPILDEASPENRQVRDAGWEISYDGMEIEL